MAVVFISPKQRQKMFFIIITGIVLAFMIFISLSVLFSEPNVTEQKISFNKAKINVDMSVFKKKNFNDLQPIPEMEKQFKYTAIGKNKKVKNGFMSAKSEQEVQEFLKNMGYVATSIKEVKIGRDNPFVSY